VRITIDNFNGQGAVDYSGAVAGATPVTIERQLNQPSHCLLQLAPGSAAQPVSGARVTVTADNGTVLFTGYVTAAPEPVYAGETATGPAYTWQVSATSDELLLDANVSRRVVECVATTAGTLLQRLTARASGGSGLPATGDALSVPLGGYQPATGKAWSSNAGALANAARASYKVLNGTVAFNALGDQQHVLNESDGSLDRSALRGARVRPAVTNVTVYGKQEPQTYVTEIFEGDGVTTVFELGQTPLLEKASVLSDTFTAAQLDPHVWKVVDAGTHVSLTASGLTFSGGQSTSPASSVSAVDTVEMGGVLTLELDGVMVAGVSEGYAGLANGSLDAASLFAGFHLRPNGTAMVVVPMVDGVEAGASASLQIGHTYTLRLRFHCKDRQRALQSYSAGGANGPVRLGGQSLNAGADLVMELQETTGGSLMPAVVLYDGSVPQAPTQCIPVAMNSVNFVGSVASFSLSRPGEVWVRVTNSGSAPATQRLGLAAQSAQAKVASTGRMSFYPGNVPAAGSVITVNYRLGGRAVARMAAASATGVSTAAASAAAGSLIVTAESPETRSSADCENAALALLSLSTWADGAWKGRYSCWSAQQPADIWPGDLLQVNAPSMGVTAGLLVRSVQVRGTSCSPELLHSTISFANEWAEPVAMHVVEEAPANAWLPPTALTAATALDSLRDLAVTSVTTTQIQIEAGVNAPAGGGFEVRRSDWKFGAGDGADLVLRTPVPNFTILREAPVERYYMRMYDGATPPNYSRFSSATFINAATQ
jgi:hypothetical protein